MLFLPIDLTINPFTIDDAFWGRLTLAACYQLVQSDRFCSSKKGGIGGGGWVYS